MAELIVEQWQATNHGWGDVWDAPAPGVLHRHDMRNLAQASAMPGPSPQGYAFFVYPDGQAPPGAAINLGSNLRANLTVQQTLSLRDLFNVPISTVLAPTIQGAIRQLLIDPTIVDPAGVTNHKGISSDFRGPRINWNGFGEIINESLGRGSLYNNVVARHRDDYERLLADGESDELLQKFVGGEMLRIFREASDDNADALMASNRRGRGWQNPTTTLTESFTEASDTALESHTGDDGQGYSLINGSMQVLGASDVLDVDSGTGTLNKFRTDSNGALSTGDQSAQLVITAFGGAVGTNQWTGVGCRMSASADTAYVVMLYRNNDSIYCQEYNSGSETTLIGPVSVTVSLPDTIKLEVGTNSQEIFFNGSSQGTATDSTVGANLRVCLYAWRNASGTQRADDGFWQDEAAGAVTAVKGNTVAVAEAPLAVRGIAPSVADTEEISEAASAIRAMRRVIDDTVELAEQTSAQLDLYRSVLDTEDISEATLFALGITRAQADTEEIAESINIALGRVRSVADVEEISETINTALGKVRAAQDTIELAEQTLASRVMTRIVNETVEIAEAASRPMVMVRPVGDVVEIAEQILKQAALVQLIAETVEISEGTVRVGGASTAITVDLAMPTRSLDLAMPTRSLDLTMPVLP